MSRTKAIAVPVPDPVGELQLLDRVDYEDAYCVEARTNQTPEQWMRSFLEGAPRWFRVSWIGLFTALGARFGPQGDPDHVLGWKILERRPDAFVVGFESSVAVARLITLTTPGQLVLATQVRFDSKRGRALWVAVGPGHRFFAPHFLGRAADAANR